MTSNQLFHVLPPVLAVGFILAAALAWRAAVRDRGHERRAQRTQGVVTKVEYSSEHQTFPTVRFRTATGEVVEARPASSVNAPLFTVGQSVGLRYDPQQPDWILVDGLPSAGCVGVAVALLLSVGAAGLVLVSVVLRLA